MMLLLANGVVRGTVDRATAEREMNQLRSARAVLHPALPIDRCLLAADSVRDNHRRGDWCSSVSTLTGDNSISSVSALDRSEPASGRQRTHASSAEVTVSEEISFHMFRPSTRSELASGRQYTLTSCAERTPRE